MTTSPAENVPLSPPRVLRPYQATIASDAVEHLAPGGRGQIHMATGTGKTLVCQRVAERAAPGEALIVVLAPTIALVAQLLADWRHDAVLAFAGFAVCSDDTVVDAPVHLSDLEIASSTDPAVVAAWLTGTAGQRRCLFGTYASAAVIADALHALDLTADMLICDEGHHLTGRADAETRRVVEPGFLPAARRLVATATARDDLRTAGVVAMYGMDDESLFGPVLGRFPLHEGIEGGWLKDYRLAVVGVTEAEARALLAADDVDYVDTRDALPLRTLAAQIAVASARRRFGIRRVISFHHRVSDAQEFARTLPRTLSRMDAARRPDGHGVFAAVHAGHDIGTRNRILDNLRHPPPEGWAVVSNARVLSEGVNIPAVDAIAFAHPKKSAVDIVQAVGRALRLSDADGEERATLVVPIVVPSSQDEVTDLDPGEYQVLWDIVRALRSHDEQLGIELDHTRTQRRPSDYELPGRISVFLPPGTADHVLAQLTVLTVRQTTSPWMDVYGAAQRYHAEYGDLLVPGDYVDPDDVRLGAWIARQRRSLASLSPRRRALLDELGMVWDVRDARWMQWYAVAKAVYDQTGELRIPHGATVDGVNLGAWLSVQRHARNRGRLSRERIALLDAIGMWWGAFGAGLAACDRYRDRFGHLDVVTSYVDDSGYPLGTWLAGFRTKPARLTAKQRAALDARGMIWSRATRSRALTAAEKAALVRERDQGSSAGLNRLIIDLVGSGAVQRQIAATLGVSPSSIRNRLKTRDPRANSAFRTRKAWYLATRRQAYAELGAAHPNEDERLYTLETPGPSMRERSRDKLRGIYPAEFDKILADVRERNPFAET
uniref:helicase associated domain-containing protein n=1 Tax=Amycolatopsis sp. CA-096443 TaxID=3239919 RepID=UPI003F4914BD